jgi:molybdopterin-synthase adenylyltransferase
MNLNEQQKLRYQRHLFLKNVGAAGQLKLLKAKVLVIGVGGLGSPAALYLAAAGVGELGLADADKVELSNLQRQIIHSTSELKVLKTDSAKEKINKLNPDVKVSLYPVRITAGNIKDIINKYDFVLDCTDNFESKFMINDACAAAKIPFSHAGIAEFQGQIMTVIPGRTACYRCLFNTEPEKKEQPLLNERGLLGVLPGTIGSLQAAECLKFILDLGELLTDQLLIYDALKMSFRKVKVSRKKDCSCTS